MTELENGLFDSAPRKPTSRDSLLGAGTQHAPPRRASSSSSLVESARRANKPAMRQANSEQPGAGTRSSGASGRGQQPSATANRDRSRVGRRNTSCPSSSTLRWLPATTTASHTCVSHLARTPSTPASHTPENSLPRAPHVSHLRLRSMHQPSQGALPKEASNNVDHVARDAIYIGRPVGAGGSQAAAHGDGGEAIRPGNEVTANRGD